MATNGTETKRKHPLSFWTGMKLWKQILIALVAGLVVGMIFGPPAAAIKPIGTIFINLIKMLIVPLIFVSLVCGITSMHDMHKMGRIAVKTVVVYLLTTAIAITVGLGLGLLLQPGTGVDLAAAAAVEPKAAPTLIETFVGLFPTNPIAAMASGNVLQIIVFAILFGLAINIAGEAGRKIREFFEWMAEVIYKLTAIIISLAPYGVFALMAWVAGTYGLDVLLPLGTVIVAVYVGCILQAIIVYGGAISLIAKLNPLRFFQGIAEAQAVAFTTTSSSGTLPVTMSCAQKNLGVSRGVSSFVLPLGATINMDGTALYQGVCALFVAQAFGISLGMGDYITIILTSTLASIGTAGVPGAGLIMLSLVLTSVGLPLEGVAIIAGIDRILDMARTTLNVTGDGMVTVLVAKSENEINEAAYNTPHVLEPEELPAE